MPIRTPDEPEPILTVARSRDEPLNAAEILTAWLLGSVAYDRARELLGEEMRTLALVSLSPRQVECIALVAQGKSDWEIAKILGLSRDARHEYVESSLRRYGVRRRTQLVWTRSSDLAWAVMIGLGQVQEFCAVAATIKDSRALADLMAAITREMGFRYFALVRRIDSSQRSALSIS